MKKYCFILSCLLIAACATPEETEARRKAQEQEDMRTCESYGLKPGSENFGMCMLQLDLARQQRYDTFRYGYGYYTPSQSRVNAGVGMGF